MFEIELGCAVDLGVVSLDRVGVRVQLDDPSNIELTALGASVDIPGALTGSGYFQIAEDGFAGRIDLTLVPIKLRIAAALNVRDIAPDPPAHDGATAVAVPLEVNFPVAIPLGTSGLGIYGLVGLFAMHFQRNEDPDQGSSTVALSWLKRAGGDPTHVEDPELWRPHIDSWAFGIGALFGTMGSDIIFNLKGMLLLELPGPRVLLMMKAKLLMPAPRPLKSDTEGLLLAVIDLNIAEHSLTIGIVIDFSISPLLELRIPVEALFDTDTPEQWHIFIGKYPDPIRANILEVFTGTGYLMLVGDAQHDAANLPSNLPGTTGFVIATGLHVSMLWGSKTIRLYAELAAGFDALLGFSPLLVAGKLYVRGELCLFIISISAHAELDVRLGSFPTRTAATASTASCAGRSTCSSSRSRAASTSRSRTTRRPRSPSPTSSAAWPSSTGHPRWSTAPPRTDPSTARSPTPSAPTTSRTGRRCRPNSRPWPTSRSTPSP